VFARVGAHRNDNANAHQRVQNGDFATDKNENRNMTKNETKAVPMHGHNIKAIGLEVIQDFPTKNEQMAEIKRETKKRIR
jgi:hypothetical protein